MKILLDLQGAQSESRWRGIGRAARAFSHAVIENAGHHDIHILLNAALTTNFDELRAEFARLLPNDHIHHFSYETPLAEWDAQNRWRAHSAALQRETKLASLCPDLVHVTSLFEGYVDDAVVSVGMFRHRHATSVTLYDLVPLADPQRYLSVPTYHHYYLRRAQELKKADHLLSISEYSRQEAIELLQIPAQDISVVPLGVHTRFRPKILSPDEERARREAWGSGRKIILHVGAADPRKNVARLVEAFSMLPPHIKEDHVLVFAGALSEEERNNVRAAAGRCHLELSDIRFTGLVEEEELISLYNLCEVLVFPSLHEGFGLPALEAMACGAAVIAADNTSLPEVIGRRDLLFDPQRSEDIVARLREILRQPGLRDDARKWGLARAKEFTWEKVGKRAVEVFETIHERQIRERRSRASFRRKPLLALLSPLPSDPSGIADYTAELIPELARYYDIECILHGTSLTDEWIRANFVQRDTEWFETHAHLYDRVLYCMGNSPFHAHMISLIRRFPGTVVLHDFFLSDLLTWVSHNSEIGMHEFDREMYRSHGLSGCLRIQNTGISGAAEAFPLNGFVFRNARGIIAHSQFVTQLAGKFYSPRAGEEIVVIPHLRGAYPQRPPQTREQLSFAPNDFVVCTFGILHPRKLNHLLVAAWVASRLWKHTGCYLVFVGEGNEGYQRELETLIAEDDCRATVRFVGYANRELYQSYLAAADIAVQLRTSSRGETSGTVLDCMASGIPVIITPIGSMADYPDDVVVKTSAAASPDDLAATLLKLHANEELRKAVGNRAREYVKKTHHPAAVGKAFASAIESFYREGNRHFEQELLAQMSRGALAEVASDLNSRRIAESVFKDLPFPAPAQIFCDVTAIAEIDLRTGIERVMRSILNRLIEQPPDDYRIEPVLIKDGKVQYARRFAQGRLQLPLGELEDSPVEAGPRDHYLVMGWIPELLPKIESWLQGFRREGGTVTILIYDLLPLKFPHFFPDWIYGVTENWMRCVLRTADRIACISKATADDVRRYARSFEGDRTQPLRIDHFPLGFDVQASSPSTGRSVEAEHALLECARRPTFLMVGTVEPRKGHEQVLMAFEVLWEHGLDVGLVIVGKEGWMVHDVVSRIRDNQNRTSKLIWLPEASDEVLSKLYDLACGLIAASLGEGFGLPLIEAASHGLPIIARDIPVFREVAGDHAFYFEDGEAQALAKRLQEWLRLYEQNLAPGSQQLPRHEWQTSTAKLLDIMFNSTSVGDVLPTEASSTAPAE